MSLVVESDLFFQWDGMWWLCTRECVPLVSLHIRSMWETTVMHKQVSGWTVNFGPNSPVYPFLELKTRIPPPPFWKTSDLGWPKFTPKYPPPPFWKTSIWDEFTPKYPPPFWKTSDLGWPKFYTPPPSSDLWPKFTPKYPPILKTWFGIHSEIPPPHHDQSLLRNPIFSKTSDLGWPKFTPKYPPPNRKLSQSSSLRFSEYRELLHMETLSNPDNY